MEQREEQERYGTITAWAETFGVLEKVVRTRLKEMQGVTGKLISGRVMQEGFYPETAVREACADLLQDHPWANEDGFFIRLEQETTVRYGTRYAWAKMLNASPTTLQKYLEGIQGVDGRTCTGVLMKNGFYSEQMLQATYPQAFQDIPKTDETGFIIQNQKRYGTLQAWADEWKIDQGTIARSIQYTQSLPAIEGKGTGGKVCTFYEEGTLKEACSESLSLPQADASGFYELSDGRYGTVDAWSGIYQIETAVLRTKLDRVRGVTGRDSEGHILKGGYFPESVIQKIYDGLQRNLPQADASGFIQIGEEKYGTRRSWGRVLNVSAGTLKGYLEDVSSIEGKDAANKVCTFYKESDVRIACASLLQDVPQADKQGFFTLDSDGRTEKYGTLYAWARKLDTSSKTINRRLQGKTGITGKMLTGALVPDGFCKESDVLPACMDILILPQAEADGFLVLDGVRYGSTRAWSRALNVTEPALSRRLDGLRGISARGAQGAVYEDAFFPEPVVREHCQDLLQELPQSDEQGFFVHYEEGQSMKYGNIYAWANSLQIPWSTIKRRLAGRKGVQGRNIRGNAREYFSEAVIMECCIDLLPPACDK